MSTKYLAAAALAAAALAAPRPAHAVPEQLGFTARVSDGGTPLTGNHVFLLRLHDAATGGTQVWTETINAGATDGLVYLTLGEQTPLDADVLDGGPLWLEVQVDSTVLAPRLPVTSAAYAVRAGVAEDAERLGGQPATAFASSTHNHAGSYLPLGTTLACPAGQKVTAINSITGSVTCAPDVDTDTNTTYSAGLGLGLNSTTFNVLFGGSGLSGTVARSDHNHAGTYLPVGTTLSCPTGQKVTGINSTNGSVTCGVDVNSIYTAGTGLLLSPSGEFSVSFTSGGWNGTSSAASRSDHTHQRCPTGYILHTVSSGGGSGLCSRRVTASATWNSAASSCYGTYYGGQLCTYAEMRAAVTANPAQTLTAGYWLGDRVGDNLVLQTNGTNTLDFDGQVDVLNSPTAAGFYCCQRAH